MTRRTPLRKPNSPAPADPNDPGELIGRRVGRGPAAMQRVLARPTRRDAYVDTSQPGVSDTDRKVGGNATARRHAKARAPRATAALEDSRTKPSRKSTRRSANRIKSAHGKARTAQLRSTSPSARAQRR